MTNTLADLDTLALKCRAERSREYIAEAILCYRAGAYRSTIVNTWIAVVFDLVDKIRDLAIANDQNALRINTQYENYVSQINAGSDQGIKSALNFERTILSTCRDQLQFFDHQQMKDLERLREDRHQCAHPSFQRAGVPHRPSAELARLHLRNAIEHVLSQPPLQGRSAITEIMTIVASEYFPKDRHQAATTLRHTPLANPSDALVHGLIDALVFGYSQPDSPVHGKVQVGVALSALLDTQRNAAETRIVQKMGALIRQIEDEGLPSVARLVVATPEIVNLIDEAARLRLAEFVRVGVVTDVLPVMAGLARNAEISTVARDRAFTFDFERLSSAVQEYGIGELAKERALDFLSESRSWNRTNEVFERLIVPLFESLERADIERIIRMPTETHADLPGATMYGQFIEQVSRTGVIPDVELDQMLRENRAEALVHWRDQARQQQAGHSL